MGRCINWLTSITVQPCLSSIEQCWLDSKQSLDGYGACIHEVMCKGSEESELTHIWCQILQWSITPESLLIRTVREPAIKLDESWLNRQLSRNFLLQHKGHLLRSMLTSGPRLSGRTYGGEAQTFQDKCLCGRTALESAVKGELASIIRKRRVILLW